MVMRCLISNHMLHIPAIASITVAVAASLVAAETSSVDGAAAAALAPKDTLTQAFGSSFAMILVSEIGDKTFFIAAILAMRHDRRAVFVGAAGALAAMTVLSACIGLVLPAILPPQYTRWAAIALFVFFGCNLIREATQMFAKGEGLGPSDELEEVEKELDESKENKNKIFSIIAQAFVLTFLAEWGDRSQISTIALAAARDALGVTFGGIIGHMCCTTVAVLGGRALAGRVPERVVAAAGGALFIVFAIHGVVAEFV